jgi:small-conductance mechanosensitive channel
MNFLRTNFPEILRATLGMAIFLPIALLLRQFLFRYATRLAEKSETKWDDVTVGALRGPTKLLILISALWIGGRAAALNLAQTEILDQLTRIGLILALILSLDYFLRGAIDLHRERLEAMHLPRTLARALLRIFVVLVGGLIVLDTLHISITPILASLGIGGLAIGLALQGTLANLFAGLQIVTDRPVRIGDFIKLQTGEEGYVTEIGWRSTRIRMPQNNLVIIPNVRLVDSVVTNYFMPNCESAVLVQVGVGYGSDLSKVESVTIEVAKEVQREVPGAIREFTPFIRFHTFDSSSINFAVTMRCKEFTDSYLIKHEFIKRLHVRYATEHIVIPSPIRTLDLPERVLDLLASPPNQK